jgi:uncharacterized protein YjiS (DUF1127 family)
MTILERALAEVEAYRKARDKQRTRRALAHMSDHMLRDIGVSRTEL